MQEKALEARGAVWPAIGAVIGAGFALLVHGVNPLVAGFAGGVAGLICGVVVGRRVTPSRAKEELVNRYEARLRDLEAELDAERAASLAFRREVDERESASSRAMGDLAITRAAMEEQAYHSVEMAEELAEQKTALEQSKQRSDYLANHDILTGLPNRRAFVEALRARVEGAQSRGVSVALLFVDLDKFKQVNDTLGHEAGDDLLKKVSLLLDAAMRDDDLAARLGGDEFAVIVDLPRGERVRKSAFNVAERLRLSLQIPTLSPKGEIAVGATIGVALFPEDASGAAELLQVADQVMYAGKRQGRNRVVMTDGVADEARGAR